MEARTISLRFSRSLARQQRTQGDPATEHCLFVPPRRPQKPAAPALAPSGRYPSRHRARKTPCGLRIDQRTQMQHTSVYYHLLQKLGGDFVMSVRKRTWTTRKGETKEA